MKIFTVLAAALVAITLMRVATAQVANCTAVTCSCGIVCDPGFELATPKDGCCPECQPVGGGDCSAVSCVLPNCEDGFVRKVPEGECCPVCTVLQCQFNCTSEDKCIPLDYTCDGIPDCANGEDESPVDMLCPFPSDPCEDGDIRLTGGSTENEGHLELCVNGSFGSVCLPEFDLVDASVACRQLGLPTVGLPVQPFRRFGLQILISFLVHRSGVNCSGEEARLVDCPADSEEETQCVATSRVGLICQEPELCEDGELRLVGGPSNREGRVEFCLSGVWGAVWDTAWTYEDAAVVCSQLGFDPLGALPNPIFTVQYGTSTVPEIAVVSAPRCVGSESTLAECPRGPGLMDVSNTDSNLVGVRCDVVPQSVCIDGEVRLIERDSEYTGVAQLCLNEVWGNLCFDRSSAHVACRQFNLPVASGFWSVDTTSLSTHDVLYSNNCNGSEDSLLDCNITTPETCQDTVLNCRVPEPIELFPGSADGVYNVDVGMPLEVRAIITDSRYRMTLYKVNDNGELTEIRSRRTTRLQVFLISAVTADDAGEYLLVASANFFNDPQDFTLMTNISIFVNVNLPEGDGSSILVRMYLPVFPRLLLVTDDFSRLEGAESSFRDSLLLFLYDDENSLSTVTCDFINRDAIAVERDLNRMLCNFTTYPPTDALARVTNSVSFLEQALPYVGLVEIEDCSTVTCPQPTCDLGFELRASQDQCCPECQPLCQFNCIFEDKCIPLDQLCDDIPDCVFGEDESIRDMTCPAPQSEPCTVDGEIRLTGSSADNEGLLEVCVNGSYRRVCISEFDLVDASVACRQLGLPSAGIPVNAFGRFGFQVFSFPFHLTEVNCSGEETQLVECPAESSEECSTVGLICQEPELCEDGELRLVGGPSNREGRVEFCRSGVWGAVVNNFVQWTYEDAAVVCSQLGFDPLGALPNPVPAVEYGPSTVPEIATFGNIDCIGSESTLTECSNFFQLRILNNNDRNLVGVRCDVVPQSVCTDGDVRLVERDAEFNGVLQLCVNGEWGNLCSSAITSTSSLAAANVACKQFDLPAAAVLSDDSGLVREIVHFNNSIITCDGSEDTLLECDIATLTQPIPPVCRDTILTCIAPQSIHLWPPSPDGVYNVNVRSPFNLRCDIFQDNFHTVVAYRVNDNGELTEIEDTNPFMRGRVYLIQRSGGITVEDGGQYLCVATAMLNDPQDFTLTTNVSIFVNVIVPEGEGSSVLVLMSFPSHLDLLDEEFTREGLAEYLEEEFIEQLSEVGNDLWTADCSFIKRDPIDVERDLDRLQCNITSYPPNDDILAIVSDVADYLDNRLTDIAQIIGRVEVRVDCGAVACVKPSCESGSVLMTPEGECCPICLNCSEVECKSALVCEPGFELTTPEGKCCPICTEVEDSCSLVVCEPIECEGDDVTHIIPVGHCCPICQTICNLDVDVGNCSIGERAFFFNRETGECERFTYSGCGGNENRFSTIRECRDTCNLCLLPPEAGPYRPTIPSYFFNSTSERCETFVYSGCQGNANQFSSMMECEGVCGGGDCPPTCSKQFCDHNRGAICSNPGPRQLPGCSGPCQLTYCSACYYSQETLSTPDVERDLPQRCREITDYSENERCLFLWANEVRKAHRRAQGPPANKDPELFRCYNPDCPESV